MVLMAAIYDDDDILPKPEDRGNICLLIAPLTSAPIYRGNVLEQTKYFFIIVEKIILSSIIRDCFSFLSTTY